MQDAMQLQIYLTQKLPNIYSLLYNSSPLPLLPSMLPLASPFLSSPYLHTLILAQTCGKLSGGGDEELIFPSQPCSMLFWSS